MTLNRLAQLKACVAIDELLSHFPDYEVDAVGVEVAHGSNIRGLTSLPIVLHPALVS
ncbi:MAG: hypothetical protein ABSE98_09945 [Acidimicrobiales bacterium]